MGFPGATVLNNLPVNARDTKDAGSIPGLGRSHGEGNGKLLHLFLPGELRGQRSLAGYSSWDGKSQT